VRQFSNSWRNRSSASGGTLDAQLKFSNKGTTTAFTVRGMNLANLRNGGREVLAISIGGGQNVRSVVLEPGLSDEQIAQRFDEALAPAACAPSSTTTASWHSPPPRRMGQCARHHRRAGQRRASRPAS
jgi:hypothetical protein